MNKSSRWLWSILALVVAGCVCLSMICIAGGVLVLTRPASESSSMLPEINPDVLVPTVSAMEPTPTRAAAATREPTRTPYVELPSSGDLAADNLRVLREEIVPVNDPISLAERLKGKSGIAATLPAPPTPLKVGDQQLFWVTNGDTDEKRQVTATLRYLNAHLYFWIENGVAYDASAMRRLADTFSNEIYPTNREFFGSEWLPGIDNDPRLHVLYVTDVGSSIAGYFSSADGFPPEALEYSNAREMFVLSADNVSLSDSYTYGTMAHEFQHMIHFYTDRNEDTWLSEGFSVLAELLNGYDVGGFDYLFMMNPDLALTYWPGPGQSGPNYGAAFLFVTYFLNRYGEEATQALVAHPENGMESVDAVLRQLGEIDPATGLPLSADDFFADWAVANYLDDPAYGGGRYDYANYPYAPKAGPTEELLSCPVGDQLRSVNQYGTDYIRIACRGAHTLTFQGASQVPLLPVDAYSGDFAFWSNRGDESDMHMTREFDLRGVSAPVELTYRAWYDLENGYDYAYLMASEDGKSWRTLRTPSGTGENPNGNNYGWGYNGQSGNEWRFERVDLSAYAGKLIQLRFEYITDTAVHKQGFLVDDIRLDALNYFADFESDDGGWQGEGFVRISNRLPQTFRVSLISLGEETSVQRLELDSDQRGSLEFNIGDGVREVIVVVSGTTRFTFQEAQYQFAIQ